MILEHKCGEIWHQTREEQMRTSIPQTVASSLQNNELFILTERAFVTPLKWKDPLDKDDLKRNSW